jgi:hypothetical protein
MDERLRGSETEPTRRQWAYGLGFTALVLALVIGIPAVLLAAGSSCACTPPADLVVLNYAHEDATLTWQGPGPLGLPVLGIWGGAIAPACSTFSQTLRPGRVSVSISTGTVHTIAITVPDGEARNGHQATIVIGPDGQVSGPTDGAPSGGYPQDPLCE